jgi:O-acetyl-ADP-ribose deacetylase (regulator of RNase III)
MIEFRTGDILETDAEALVNTVNCVGIMGRGIALQFKKKFPANFKAYKAACDREELQPGRMFTFKTDSLVAPKYIINFPTKRHWRGKSRLADIEFGLEALVTEIRRLGITSIAIPPLGSGLGGLEWQEVKSRIATALSYLKDVNVIVFEPRGATDPQEIVSSRDVPKMTPGRAALVILIDRYLRGLMDPLVTLLEIHKLMYFMQEAGQPLKLQYKKGPYGPYAENLRHVLHAIEGHLVSGYADGGDRPNKPIKLVPGAVKDAEAFLEDEPDIQTSFNRVADLVEGFETSFGLELLSTVHWVATREGATGPEEVVAQTYAWNDRKRQFSDRQIALTYRTLLEKDWLQK